MSSQESSSDDGESWISWFCGLPGHELLCEIDRGYIEDSFNLYGLRPYVRNFKESLDIILDNKQLDTDGGEDDYLQNASLLYGLIHARYIITMHGLDTMCQKYDRKEFGECPRTLCQRQAIVPLGTKDEPRQDTVRLFCPRCQQVYNPPPSAAGLDGAYFGTTFAHLFFMTYEEKVPEPCREVYIPRVFGFKVHKSSNVFPHLENGDDACGDTGKEDGEQPRRQCNNSKVREAFKVDEERSRGGLTSTDDDDDIRRQDGKSVKTGVGDGKRPAATGGGGANKKRKVGL